MKHRPLSHDKKAALCGLAFVSPWVLGLIVFNLFPILYSLYLSFTSYSLVGEPKFTGFANYVRLFTKDSYVMMGVKNTLYFTFLYVPIWFLLGLGFALMMNQKMRGAKLFRTVAFLPSLVTVAATASIWSWLMNTNMGVFNAVIRQFGGKAIPWLSSVQYSKISVLIMALWPVGSVSIIYLVALQSIPQDILEASYIDGATPIRRLFSITLPMISPTIYFNVLISVISALQIFAESILLTKGGPANSTMFYVYYLYKTAFSLMDFGYASAIAWVFFAVVLFFVLIYQHQFSKRVFYQ